MDVSVMRTVEKEAREFAEKEKIRQMILYLLKRSGRPLMLRSGEKKRSGFWGGRRNKEDTRFYRRQLPLNGSGVMLVQEHGYRARGVLALLRQDNQTDQVVFESPKKGVIKRFRIGFWTLSLRAAYDAAVVRELRPEIVQFEQGFEPVHDFGDIDHYAAWLALADEYRSKFSEIS